MDARIPTIRSPYEAAVHTPAAARAPQAATADSYAGSVMPDAAAAPPPAKRHRLRKVALGALTAVSLLGVGGVTGISVLAHAPICQTQSIAFQNGHLCVSEKMGAQTGADYRYMRSIPYQGQLIHDLQTHGNDVYHPHGHAAPPRTLMADGNLRVVSWNLHKSQSPDRQGARPEDAAVIERMRAAGGDVYILQEVGPWQVQQLVNATGMNGYYSMTIPDQGDLILVNPSINVTASAHTIVNEDLHGMSGALHGVKEWATQSGEPRQAQALRLELPDGRSTVVWNSHLMTTADLATPEGRAARTAEAQNITAFLDQFARPGEPVIGGGDFNAESHTPTLDVLRADGFATKGSGIDWITSRGTGDVAFDQHVWLQSDGVTQISDHVMVWGDISLPRPA